MKKPHDLELDSIPAAKDPFGLDGKPFPVLYMTQNRGSQTIVVAFEIAPSFYMIEYITPQRMGNLRRLAEQGHPRATKLLALFVKCMLTHKIQQI